MIQITGGQLSTLGGTLTGPLEIAVGSAAAPGLAMAGDSNTGLWAPAADTLALATAGVEAIRVTGAQFVGIGVAAPATELQVATTLTTSPRGIMSSQHSAGVDGARFHMRKSRGTNASPTVITAGDVLGRLVASGYDGANYLEMGGIDIVSAGTIASTQVPTEIRFFTATDAAPSVLTQRMVIDKAGNVGIGMTLPSAPLQVVAKAQFNTVFITNNTTPSSLIRIGHGSVVGDTYGLVENLTAGGATYGNLVLQQGGGNVGIGLTAPTAALHLPASSTARASLRIPAGTAPTIPNAGDIWVAGTVLKFFDGTTTKEIAFV